MFFGGILEARYIGSRAFLEEFPDHLFAVAIAVDEGRIQEIHPEICCPVECS